MSGLQWVAYTIETHLTVTVNQLVLTTPPHVPTGCHPVVPWSRGVIGFPALRLSPGRVEYRVYICRDVYEETTVPRGLGDRPAVQDISVSLA